MLERNKSIFTSFSLFILEKKRIHLNAMENGTMAVWLVPAVVHMLIHTTTHLFCFSLSMTKSARPPTVTEEGGGKSGRKSSHHLRCGRKSSTVSRGEPSSHGVNHGGRLILIAAVVSGLVVQLPPALLLTMSTEEPESKKQINEGCIINLLPGDLIERIFLRLPVSTLLRCGRVCKQWQNYIRDPQFVASHLKCECEPKFALLFFPQGLVYGEHYPSEAILIDEAWSPSTYAVPVIGPDDFLFGSCNGLLGLYTKTSAIKIANFTTGECLYLEKPAKNVKGDRFCFYNFAFHPVTKEYKITHFLGDCVNGRPHNKDWFNIIQVYTLGDEKWKDIRTPQALSLTNVRNSGVVNVDGKMYWLTEDMSASWQHAVISFDLREESFAKIQLPEEREDNYYLGPRKFWIRDIDGKICIVTAQPSRHDPRALLGDLQIWTLGNTVELQGWSKKYNIKNPPNYIPGPHFVYMDRIISQLHISVCSYELFSENFEIDLNKKVKLFDSRPRWFYIMQSYICVKSLVSLDVYKKAAIVRRSKQQVGWELKKWKAWEDKRREIEDIRSWVHKHEHVLFGKAEKMGKMYQYLQDKTHAVAERLRAELNQVLRDKPDNPSQPKSPRRLNWVEQKRDNENLMARSTKLKERIQVMKQAYDNISSIIASLVLDKGKSSAGASSSSSARLEEKKEEENI